LVPRRGLRRASRVTLGLTASWLSTLVVLAARTAAAYDVGVALRTVGQGYQERRYDPRGGNEVLSRRRLTQYLTLSVDHLEPGSWAERGDSGQINAGVILRFDMDFGRYATAAPGGANAIGELPQNQVDVLQATVTGRDLAGRLDFELGRQIHLDALDFWAVDGLRLDVRLWRALRVEGLAATEVRGERPISAPIFELDGTSAGDKDPASRAQQNAALRPTAGAALTWRDELSPVGARVAYRRSWSATVGDVAPAGPGTFPSTGINAEHLVAMADVTTRWVSAEGGARYDFLTAAWNRHEVALRVGRERRSVVLEQSYFMPTFDGDSIWNVFAHGAFRDWRARFDQRLGARAQVYAAVYARHYAEGSEGGGSAWASGGHAGLVVREGAAFARVDLVGEGGWGGHRWGLDVAGRRRMGLTGFAVEGRLTASSWQSSPAVGQAGTLSMAGVQVGAHYPVTPLINLHGLLEDNVGPYDRSNVRLLVVLDVRTAP